MCSATRMDASHGIHFTVTILETIKCTVFQGRLPCKSLAKTETGAAWMHKLHITNPRWWTDYQWVFWILVVRRKVSAASGWADKSSGCHICVAWKGRDRRSLPHGLCWDWRCPEVVTWNHPCQPRCWTGGGGAGFLKVLATQSVRQWHSEPVGNADSTAGRWLRIGILIRSPGDQ